MEARTLIDEVMIAFADVRWPHDSPPEEIEPRDAQQVVDELFQVSDATKKYELPRLMCLAVTLGRSDMRDRVLCRLVEFLDVDFADPEGTNDLIKEAKRRIFSNYSGSQSKAIWRWLEYVRTEFELLECHDLLSSALKFWRERNQVA